MNISLLANDKNTGRTAMIRNAFPTILSACVVYPYHEAYAIL